MFGSPLSPQYDARRLYFFARLFQHDPEVRQLCATAVRIAQEAGRG